jgi:hypothetical protein
LIWIKDPAPDRPQHGPKGITMDQTTSQPDLAQMAFGLTRGMARSVGVNLIEAVTEGWYSRRELADLVQRCDACGKSDPCMAWLAATPRAASLPAYCANKAEIEALRL